MSGIGWKAANINDKLARVKAKNGRSRLRSEISERITAASRTRLGFLQDGDVGLGAFRGWRLVRFKRQADAAQEVLKARVSAKGIQLGVGGDPGRAVRALVEGFSQPQES